MQLKTIAVICILTISGIMASQDEPSGIIMAKKSPERQKQPSGAQEGPLMVEGQPEAAKPSITDFLDAVIEDNMERVRTWIPQIQTASKVPSDSEEFEAIKAHLDKYGIMIGLPEVPIQMAIRLAISFDRLDMVKLFIDSSTNRTHLEAAIKDAAEFDRVEILKYLLPLNYNPMVIDRIFHLYGKGKRYWFKEVMPTVDSDMKIACAELLLHGAEESEWLDFASYMTYDELYRVQRNWLAKPKEEGESEQHRASDAKITAMIEKAVKAAILKSVSIITNFLDAIIDDNLKRVRALIPEIEDAPHIEKDGPKHRAISGHLLERGITGKLSEVPIQMAIHVAISADKLDAVKLLMETPTGDAHITESIKCAANLGRVEILKYLLSLSNRMGDVNYVFDHYRQSNRDMVAQAISAVDSHTRKALALHLLVRAAPAIWSEFASYLTYDELGAIHQTWLAMVEKGSAPKSRGLTPQQKADKIKEAMEAAGKREGRL